MLLKTFYEGIEVHRKEKIIVVKFLMPHRVISTCRANGGLRDDLDLIFNHQSCEPTGHRLKSHSLAVQQPLVYLQQICLQHGLSENCASLGTAANMNCAALESETFHGLEVVAVCTGGVETNAGRAGDPASIYEEGGRFIPVSDTILRNGKENCAVEKAKQDSGTINIIICISRELAHGAMIRAVMTATEAKTAVLQELNVKSRYSGSLATGTGTDQIAVACALRGNKPLTGAGKHTKLGELIGLTVKKAVAGTLKLQNGMSPQSRCSTLVHIERFGADADTMKAGIKKYLEAHSGELLSKNFASIDHDPVTVAATAALVHLRDKLGWQILPESCAPEIFSSYGAHLAAAVSGKYERFMSYKNRLDGRRFSLEDAAFVDFICFCMAMGFEEKWKGI
ncbi:MAG: adenosylcobinamide amidohydrolase [Deltaproteobacteria bacterium]|nr:adenosylcobinamide amidohydrolase [Deltaproteobacteria bacterium]MBW2077732.1 adenosylcobinamide amidohydrolase [Deltaproteobacteria bacterium]